MTVYHYAKTLEVFAQLRPDSDILVTNKSRITVAELFQRSGCLAGHFHRLGVKAGDNIATMLINRPAIVETFYAALLLGARPANVNPRYGPEEIAYILADADARVLVHEASAAAHAQAAVKLLGRPVHLLSAESAEYEQALQGAPAPGRTPRPDDQIIWYTGGTTGMPRGVIWEIDTHYRMLWEVIKPNTEPPDPRALATNGRRKAPTTLPGSPLAHGTAMGLSLNAINGGGVIILHEQASFDAPATLHLIERECVAVLGIVGDAYARPLLAELDTGRWAGRLDSLKAITSSGAVWSARVRAGLRNHIAGVRLIDNFGSTEALLTRDIDGSGFQPRPGLVVLKPDDTFVKPGSNEIGVIATAGRLPKGYLNDPAKTAEVFRVIDGTRYLVIGDEAMIESDGRIKILGRGTSCINTGGEKVWPEEIEVTIRDHPEVADAAVFGMPDEKWGQKVTAVVTVRDSAKVSDEQLHAHCRGRLAGYKCPKQWIRIPHVPRTYVGKPDYKAIHQILDEMAVASQYPANDSMRS